MTIKHDFYVTADAMGRSKDWNSGALPPYRPHENVAGAHAGVERLVAEDRERILDGIDECPGLTMAQDKWLSDMVRSNLRGRNGIECQPVKHTTGQLFERGQALERLGLAMQNADTTVVALAELAHAAGLRLGRGVDGY